MLIRVLRVGTGVAVAMVVATIASFLGHGVLDAQKNHGSYAAELWQAFAAAVSYGLIPVLALAAGAEVLRVRHISAYAAAGLGVTFFAAALAVRGEPPSSAVYSGGVLTGFTLLALAILPALAYWAVAGRRSGWRGEGDELSAARAREAYRTASANTDSERCYACVAAWAGASLVSFAAAAWFLIDGTGLRSSLMTQVEREGNAALARAGFTWASFTITGTHGIIDGAAPDELARRFAIDSVHEALEAATGFPGVLAAIDNRTIARPAVPPANPEAMVAEVRREAEARLAAEAARIAAEAAKSAEEEANRRFEEKFRAAEAASKAKAQVQAQVQVQARDQQEQSAKQKEAESGADPAVAPPPQPSELASLEDAPAPTAEAVGATPAPAEFRQGAAACTVQDLAIIESSNVYFEHQRFDVTANAEPAIDRLAASAQACPQQLIQVSGYSDPASDSVFNRALGLQRAESVRDALVQRGVPATRLSVRSLGFSSSGSGDQTPLNRRAEFRLVGEAELSRDATLGPDERATTCESDLAQIMSQSIIRFASTSARIDADSLELIRKLAKSIQTCGSVIVTVEGHTDKTGDPGYNQALSESRANAVREALILAGADTTRLASRGFSFNQPFDPGNNAQAFALNRRIEFKVSGKFTSTNTRGP